MPLILLALIIGALSICPADAQVFVIGPDSSIQQIINKAKDGDTIRLKQGKYKDNLIIKKDLRILGDGPGVIIEPLKETAPVLIVDDNTKSLIERIVIQNARPAKSLFAMYASFPSAIAVRNSCPTFKHLTLINNVYFDGSSAVAIVGKCKGSNHTRFLNSIFINSRSESVTSSDSYVIKLKDNASIVNCSFVKNEGAIKVSDGAKAAILRNVFAFNGKKHYRGASRIGFDEAIFFTANENAAIRENLFVDNTGGALSFSYGEKSINFKTIDEAQKALPDISEFAGSIALNFDGKPNKNRLNQALRGIKMQLKGKELVVDTGPRNPENYGNDQTKVPGVLGGRSPHPDFK